MDRPRISTVLLHAAGYIDAHGLRTGGFGRPGRRVCVNSAIAIGLGVEPDELGWGRFFRPGTSEGALAVAEVVLESGLLDMLPPPLTEAWKRRRGRASKLSPRQALVEVARWVDAPGRTAEQAVRALRSAALRLQQESGQAAAVRPASRAA
jgi:hypothetical protein